MNHLEELESESIHIIREAVRTGKIVSSTSHQNRQRGRGKEVHF